jgi:hypothetical protein
MRTWGPLRVISSCEWERVSQPDRIQIEEDDLIVGTPGWHPYPSQAQRALLGLEVKTSENVVVWLFAS